MKVGNTIPKTATQKQNTGNIFYSALYTSIQVTVRYIYGCNGCNGCNCQKWI
jgi:cbb3-type cytochrome oxidase cytochrome c subunit